MFPLPVVSPSPRPDLRTIAHFCLMVQPIEMDMELLFLVFTLNFFEGNNKCTLYSSWFLFHSQQLLFLKKKNKMVLLTISLIVETRAYSTTGFSPSIAGQVERQKNVMAEQRCGWLWDQEAWAQIPGPVCTVAP